MTGYINSVEFITILTYDTGTCNKRPPKKTGLSCVIKGQSVTDPSVIKQVVETVTPFGCWVLDYFSETTDDCRTFPSFYNRLPTYYWVENMGIFFETAPFSKEKFQ